MNRKRLALLAVVAAVFLSGCGIFGGGGEISDDDLLEEQEYRWDSNATATYDLDVSSDSYTAVLNLTNREELKINTESAIQGDQSVGIEALQFQFRNGTVVNATHQNLTAREGSDATTIELPAENGTVGFTAPRNGKSWSTPTFVTGDYLVYLPESARVGIPLLSRATPGADEQTLDGDQMTLYWEEIEEDETLSVRYYLVRDLYLFGGLFALAVSVGIGGFTYYYRQIRRAKKKREDVGLDVEVEDDDVGDDGPPPGMR